MWLFALLERMSCYKETWESGEGWEINLVAALQHRHITDIIIYYYG